MSMNLIFLLYLQVVPRFHRRLNMWYDPLSHSQVIYEHNRKMFVVTHGSELYIYCSCLFQ